MLPNSVSSRPPDMSKHRLSSGKAGGGEQQFENLLTTMGMDKANPFSRAGLTWGLEQIEREFIRAVAVSGKQPNPKLVRRYCAAITKLLTLSSTIGPDFFGDEIERAGLSRLNPDMDDSMLRAVMEEHRHGRDDLVARLTRRRLDVEHWLKITGNSYKRRDVRKLVVEPFLQLMTEFQITTSRKQLPRTRIFDALFNWLGVERKFRPSDAAINAIARELKGSGGDSKSNA